MIQRDLKIPHIVLLNVEQLNTIVFESEFISSHSISTLSFQHYFYQYVQFLFL